MSKLLEDLIGSLPEDAKIMEECWKRLEELTVHPLAGAMQRRELRTAFFAGAQAMHTAMVVGAGEGEVPTEKELGYFDRLHKELVEYGEAIHREAGEAGHG